MLEWRRIPWPLWVYCAGYVPALVAVEMTVHGRLFAKAMAPVLVLVGLYFLLRGVRWLWIAALCLNLAIVIDIFSGTVSWWGAVSTAIGVTLLLLPVTRRFFSPRSAPVEA
jgi:uncharacterized membrane protein